MTSPLSPSQSRLLRLADAQSVAPSSDQEAYDLGILERVGLMRVELGSHALTEAGRRYAKAVFGQAPDHGTR